MGIVKHLKNRNGVASPCRTTCTVCGDAPCYAFLSIQLYREMPRSDGGRQKYLLAQLSMIRSADTPSPLVCFPRRTHEATCTTNPSRGSPARKQEVSFVFTAIFTTFERCRHLCPPGTKSLPRACGGRCCVATEGGGNKSPINTA